MVKLVACHFQAHVMFIKLSLASKLALFPPGWIQRTKVLCCKVSVEKSRQQWTEGGLQELIVTSNQQPPRSWILGLTTARKLILWLTWVSSELNPSPVEPPDEYGALNDTLKSWGGTANPHLGSWPPEMCAALSH